MINGAKYNFYQVHWHTPSENTVDGVEYPLEAHFVHQLDDPTNGGLHRLAVIGLLYEFGDDPDAEESCNEFLDYFWSDFPTDASGAADYTGGQALDFNAKLSASLAEGYYHWFGSLTTPPCTEGVSWNLLTARQTVCRRQVDLLKTALGNTQSGLQFNNRVPQPLNHRVVSHRHCSSSDALSEVHVMVDGQPKGYSMINGAKYNFYQVHWHTPSENTVDGESFPLEAHFVHQLDDPTNGGLHRLAVIGLLYEDGECNTFLDKFWDDFPEKKGVVAYDGDALDFDAELSAALAQGYYHWYGSLTTPPCTEGVSWNLLKVRQTVCARQVNVLKA